MLRRIHMLACAGLAGLFFVPLSATTVSGAGTPLPVKSFAVPEGDLLPQLVATGQGQIAVVGLVQGGSVRGESVITRFGLDGAVVSSVKVPLEVSAMKADERGRLWYVGIGDWDGAATTQLGLLDVDSTNRVVHTFPPKAKVQTLAVNQGAAWVYDDTTSTLQRILESGVVATIITSPSLRPSSQPYVSLTASPDGNVWVTGGGLRRQGSGYGGLIGRVSPDTQFSTTTPRTQPGDKAVKAFRVQQDLTGTQQWTQLYRVSKDRTGKGSGETLARILPSGALQRVPNSFTQGTRSKPWNRTRPPIGLLVAPDSVGGIWAVDIDFRRVRYFSIVTRKLREHKVSFGSRWFPGSDSVDAVVAADGNLWLIGEDLLGWSLRRVDTP